MAQLAPYLTVCSLSPTLYIKQLFLFLLQGFFFSLECFTGTSLALRLLFGIGQQDGEFGVSGGMHSGREIMRWCLKPGPTKIL